MVKSSQVKVTFPGARKGAAAVEFAVVLPLIFLLFFGVVELCCALQVQSSLNNIAREAARHSITVNATDRSTQLVSSEWFRATRIKSGSISVSPNNAQEASPGTMITVTASAPAAANSFGLLRFLRNVDLHATVVMRKE